ncbi:hypothetical protein CAPTEDRAFT_221027 [Capitella teleta]|uniref:UBA domain-containing protein n=1 Tax=Capitella teleta TaxID=283909 RepID=R7V866_CAPTE|nr:hypothetical protein CAPTEDRAFT_221027 [Capitella teleta]|eukprot:ELU15058.1 hypothetical protein CAPTEDRAFT_221027 [Capitella teleta]
MKATILDNCKQLGNLNCIGLKFVLASPYRILGLLHLLLIDCVFSKRYDYMVEKNRNYTQSRLIFAQDYSPVTKGLTGTLVLSSVAFIYPLKHHAHIFQSTYDTLYTDRNVTKFLLSKLVFLDPKDIFCAGILLYHFRIFERRFGSRKFASYLFTSFTLSLLIEAIFLYFSPLLSISLDPMPSGPVAMVCCMFLPYFCDVPRVPITRMLGIPITGKSLTYILGLQLCSTSLESAILMAIGILAGAIGRVSTLSKRIIIPQIVARACNKILGGILQSPAPNDSSSAIGATLEIQRQQQVEQLEQQMAWSQMQQRGNRNAFNLGELFQNNFPAEPAAPAAPAPVQHAEPTEEQIQQLIDMGFQRERVMGALQENNNDVTGAINSLLHQ